MKNNPDLIEFPDGKLKIISVADKVPQIDNNFPALFHEEIEIKLFFDSYATLLIGDETVVVGDGDIVVINPYKFHSTINIDENEPKYHLLMISLDFFADDNLLDLRHIFLKERTAIEPLIRQNPRLCSIIKEITDELSVKRDMYRNVVKGLVLELFSLMLRDYRCASVNDLPEEKNISAYNLVSPAIELIREKYTESFSVEELASLCNISKYHFCRTFKSVTSLSPLQYQTMYRIKVADALLKHSSKSVSEIAGLCGFSDALYFSRCYKKHTGLSPQNSRAILSI